VKIAGVEIVVKRPDRYRYARKKYHGPQYRDRRKCAISLWGTCLNNYALIAIALVTFGAIPLVALRMLWRQRHIAERILAGGVRQAIGYALNHWPALTRYIEHGFLAIDNNWARARDEEDRHRPQELVVLWQRPRRQDRGDSKVS
jgi:Transposase IS66 family